MVGVYKSIYGLKLEKFRNKLGCSRFEAIGILVSLWLYAEERENKNGELEPIPCEELESLFGVHMCGSEYSPEKIVSALEETRWIDRDGKNVNIHDWKDWQYSLRAFNNQSSYNGKEEPSKEADECTQISIDGSESPSEPKLSTNKKNKNEYTEDFEEFWQAYPRRVEKAKAFKVYQARIREGYTASQLKEATEMYKVECRRRGTEEWFIKHPATFLGPSKPFLEFLNTGNNDDSSDRVGRTITDEYDYSVPFLT